MAAVTRLRLHVMNTGLPAYTIANQTGVHATWLAKYMTGSAEIKHHHLHALAGYLHAEPSELVGWVELADLLSVGASS